MEFGDEILGWHSVLVERNSCYYSPQYTFIPPVSSCLLWTCVDRWEIHYREIKFERDDRSNRWMHAKKSSKNTQPQKKQQLQNNKPHKNFLQQSTPRPHTYRFWADCQKLPPPPPFFLALIKSTFLKICLGISVESK